MHLVDKGQAVGLHMIDNDAKVVSNALGLFNSALILHHVVIGEIDDAIKLSKNVSSHWISLIRHRKDTSSQDELVRMNSIDFSAQKLSNCPEIVATVLSLSVCVALGAVGGFRKHVFDDSLNLSDALYLTQYVLSLLFKLKKVLIMIQASSPISSKAGDESIVLCAKIRQDILELVPLGRLRLLIQVKQTKAALEFCETEQYIRLSKKEIDVENTKVKEAPDGFFEINTFKMSALLPVSKWVLLNSLGNACLHFKSGSCLEIAQVIENVCAGLDQSSWGSEPFSTLLSCEKEWMYFLDSWILNCGDDQANELPSMGLSFSESLLRESPKTTDSVLSSFMSSMERIEASSKSSLHPSFAGEFIHFRIGIAMWLGPENYRLDKSKCLACLVKAAKLSPEFGSIYSYIGHFYLVVLNDRARATKCYVKALTYDAMDAEAGISLSKIYIEAGELSKAQKLWNDANELTENHAHWTHSLAGQANLSLGNYEEASKDFQKALELCENNIILWHRLSACYISLNQNVAAVKSLKYALNLADNVLLSQRKQWQNVVAMLLCQLAEAERKIGSFQDAFDHFGKASDICSSFSPKAFSSTLVAGLKGQGDVCLALSYERLTCGWTAGVYRAIVMGLGAVSKAIDHCFVFDVKAVNPSVLACLLKLKGDLCCFFRHVSPSENSSSEIASSLSICEYDWIIDKLTQAEECYREQLAIYQQLQEHCDKQQDEPQLAVSISACVVSSWYDIGSALYFKASLDLTSRGQGSGLFSTSFLLSSRNSEVSASSYLKKALDAFICGILLDPRHGGCWNGAGLCCYLDDSLSELCLSRATYGETEGGANPSGYSNLGSLYLRHNMQGSAKACLSSLQMLESNPLHWLTLGSLLEKAPLGENEEHALSHKRSVLDAYAAALEVCKPVSGLLGVATAYMRLRGFIDNSCNLVWAGSVDWPISVDIVSIRYNVEYPLRSFLHRYPLHLFAWHILAWSLVQRDAWVEATDAYISGLKSLELCLTRSSLLKTIDESGTAESQHYLDETRKVVASFFVGLNICENMRSSSARAKLADILNQFPVISRMAPGVLEISSYDSQVTMEQQISFSIIQKDTSTFCELLGKRKLHILGNVDTADPTLQELKSLVSWMRLLEKAVQSVSDARMSELLSHFVDMYRIIFKEVGDTACPQKNFILSTLQIYPKGFIQIGEACLALEKRMAISVLQLGSEMHPFNPAILNMLGKIDSSSTLSVARNSLDLCRAMLSFSLDEDAALGSSSTRRPSCGDQVQHSAHHALVDVSRGGGGCGCPQQLAASGEAIPLYCDSVNISCSQFIGEGHRCTKSDRKHILTALWLDPSNMQSWATLASAIYSDSVLGSDEDVSSGNECGVFASAEMLGICVDIVPSLDISSLIKCTQKDVVASRLGLAIEAVSCLPCNDDICDEKCIPIDCPLLVEVFAIIRQARRKCFDGMFIESLSLFQEGVKQLRKMNLPSLLTATLIEVGNVNSSMLNPVEACEHYEEAANSSESLYGFTQILAALAYVRHAALSSDHDDVTKSRQYLDNACKGDCKASLKVSAHFVRAALWIVLSKPNKAKQEIMEAKSLSENVKVPFQILSD